MTAIKNGLTYAALSGICAATAGVILTYSEGLSGWLFWTLCGILLLGADISFLGATVKKESRWAPWLLAASITITILSTAFALFVWALSSDSLSGIL